MGRKSIKENRRKEIVQAFGRVLADHGFSGATMIAVAEEANLSPGLLHHYFKNKDDMLDELLTFLINTFKDRLAQFSKKENAPNIEAYINASLKLDQNSDPVSAKCWVGLFAEALRNPALFNRVQRHLETEVSTLSKISNGTMDVYQSSSLIAFIFGSLIFGSFLPKKAKGFAVPSANKLIS